MKERLFKQRLVAHRGYRQIYPENTLLALEQAVAAGITRLEFDIQLTEDLVPVLFHDLELKRTCGVPGAITDISYEQLQTLSAGESARFGAAFADETVPALQHVADWAEGLPELVLYAEVKVESIQHFGYACVIDQILPVVEPLRGRLVLISFDDRLISMLQDSWSDTGLVLRQWPPTPAQLSACKPKVLFINKRRVGLRAQLHQCGIPVVVYEIDTIRRARHWLKRGAHYLETFSCGSLVEKWRDLHG